MRYVMYKESMVDGALEGGHALCDVRVVGRMVHEKEDMRYL
jgi:hypothetical protein